MYRGWKFQQSPNAIILKCREILNQGNDCAPQPKNKQTNKQIKTITDQKQLTLGHTREGERECGVGVDAINDKIRDRRQTNMSPEHYL